MKRYDKISRKGWRKGRFATVISEEPDKDGTILARFGRRGKYFEGYAENYYVINETKTEAGGK